MIANMLLVAIGGFFGACARYGLGGWIGRRFPAVLPRATLTINLTGSFLLGLLAGANWGDSVTLLCGTGFMGAYTTFSTFNVENFQLMMKKEWKVLLLYVGASYIFGIALAYAGFEAGTAIQG